jgi:Flavin containing amine oxidoreductase
VFDHDRNQLPDDLAKIAYETVWGQIEAGMKHSNVHAGTTGISEKLSLLDWMRETLPKLIAERLELEHERRPQNYPEPGSKDWEPLVQKLLNIGLRTSGLWGAFVGSEVSTQSLRFLWLEECLDGENPFCAGTYTKVLEAVSSPLLSAVESGKAKLLFNREVQHVASSSNSAGRVEVTFVDKTADEKLEKLSFDEVVVTVPLGWWKQNLDRFSPAVPKRFSQAVESLGYGNLEKVYVTFPSAFWVSGGEDGTSTTDLESDTAASESTSATGDAEDSDSVPDVNIHDATGVSTQLKKVHSQGAPSSNAPSVWTFLSSDLSRPLTQETLSLSCLPAPHNHPTLLFYTSGPTSIKLSSLSDASPLLVTSDIAKHPIISSYLEPIFKCLPNYNESDPSCQPVAFLFTNWEKDEYAGNGSYTYQPVGGTELDADVECLRHGLPERGIWLAGEHTAPFVALGTVTGAWWSGDAVAKRVMME